MIDPQNSAYDEESRLVPVVMPPEIRFPGEPVPETPEVQERTFSPIEITVSRMALGLELRPMSEVAAELGVSQQAVSDTVGRVREILRFRRSRKKRTANR